MSIFDMLTPKTFSSLWRHNEREAVSAESPSPRLFAQTFIEAQIKETPNFHVTGLFEGIHRWPMDSPLKGPMTQRMFPFDDVIMLYEHVWINPHGKRDWWFFKWAYAWITMLDVQFIANWY